MKAVDKGGFVTMLKARNLDVSFAESDPAQAAAPAAGGAAAPPGAKPAGQKPFAAAKR
jgi:hypothetical protein